MILATVADNHNTEIYKFSNWDRILSMAFFRYVVPNTELQKQVANGEGGSCTLAWGGHGASERSCNYLMAYEVAEQTRSKSRKTGD